MRSAIGVSLLALCCAHGVFAQSVSGSGAISGYVLEGPDDGLPDATVMVTNAALGVQRSTLSNDEGAFDVLGLPPGPGYKLAFTRKGFAKWESAEFEVRVGRTLVFRVEMNREKPSANAKVEDVTADVEDNQAGILGWYSPTQVKLLPSIQRVPDSVAASAPLVTRDANSGILVFHGDPSAAFLADGIDVTNGYYGPRPGIGGPFTLESIQEMQVLSGQYPAEFGRASGGEVNAVTPMGGNQFHGSGFDFMRTPSFQSPGRFALGNNLLGKRNQGGGSFGGPLIRDHLSFFANFESMTDDFSGINRITAPTLSDPTGTSIPASNCTATAAQCAAAIKFIQSQMNVVTPFSQNWNIGFARVDYRRSDTNSFSGEFKAGNTRAPEEARLQLVAPNGGQLGLTNTTDDTRFARVAWTAAPKANWINELRLGMLDEKVNEPASQPFSSAIPNVAITVAGANVGSPHPYSTYLDERRYQLVENFSLTMGGHSIRVGADLSRSADNINSLNTAGTYVYPTLTAFAQDFSGGTARSYTSFNQQFGTAPELVHYREINSYAQDTWKALSRLDIIFGVRWDKTFLPQPSVTNTNYYQTATIASPNISFSPRLGLSYLLNDTTVVRLGYGFFFAPYQGQFLDALLNGNGLSQTITTVNANMAGAPLFPKVLTFGTAPQGSTNLMYAIGKLRAPHSQQATIAIEKRLARNTTLTLDLMNNRTVKLFGATDQNLTAPTKTGTYPIDDASGAVVGSYTTNMWTARNDSKYARIFQVDNSNSAYYNAASLSLRQQMAHGLSVQASYMWSHATGTSTGPLWDNAFPLNSVPGSAATDKGNLPFDQRQRGVIAWVWQPKVTRNDSVAARWLANGWQLSGIASFASGQPVTDTVLLTGNQFSTVAMAYINSLNGSGGWNSAGFQGIGTFHTESQSNLDARVGRTLPFTERVKGLVSFEAYNLTNNQRATSINSVGYMAVAALPVGIINGPYNGVLKPVAGAGTGNASTSYPDGISARRFQLAFRLDF